MQREHRDRDADQDPGRHAAFYRLQRDEARGGTGPHHDTNGHHGIQQRRRGVIGDAERHRHPQHQQKTQRHAGPQNRLVPIKEKRVCPSRHNVTQAVKKLFVMARGRQEAPGRAATKRGIYRLATTAPA